MKYIKLLETTEVEDITHKIMANPKLARTINDTLSGAHAFLLSSSVRIGNDEFKSVMRETVGKIIDQWEF